MDFEVININVCYEIDKKIDFEEADNAVSGIITSKRVIQNDTESAKSPCKLQCQLQTQSKKKAELKDHNSFFTVHKDSCDDINKNIVIAVIETNENK